MNKALLDTDTFSELGKAVDPTVVRNGAAYLAAFGRYTVSVVTVLEIVRGLTKKQALKQLQAFFAGISSQEVLVFDHAAAALAGRIEGELERVGRPIGRADPMIAAIALVNGLELVTGNTAHYQRIQQIGHPLILHDWRT
ncbi:type II toxin-antitoxin system VapC family toxin [Paludisphaera rhizosphaerae]|uniref:type II toxin-antitoxin system VapC family toxin n=1 Tax=Paludisphaera rhizosphaerae TaxID=2711216 RepID=UPI0013ED3B53|nr:type II toxin-antitoxin system VapC family toxin [Paludisphaera rhizosphaerae]